GTPARFDCTVSVPMSAVIAVAAARRRTAYSPADVRTAMATTAAATRVHCDDFCGRRALGGGSVGIGATGENAGGPGTSTRAASGVTTTGACGGTTTAAGLTGCGGG